MAAALEARLVDRGIRLQTVDIDTDPELKARFGWDVPLLFGGGVELFRHEFSLVAFEAWLKKV